MGKTIKSSCILDLPKEISTQKADADIVILENDNLELPKKLEVVNCYGNLEQYHYYKKNLLYVRITNGTKIDFRCIAKLSSELLSNLLLNIPIGYCLYQRSKLVLHGSSIRIGSKSIGFLGESGSGKSTIAASLMRKGEIISEDICYIDFNQDNAPQIFSMPEYIKLNQDTIDEFNLKFKKQIPIPQDQRQRHFCYFDKKKLSKKNKISTIYLLKWGDSFNIYKPDMLELFSFLNLCAFNCYPIDSCKKSNENLFKNLSLLSKKINFYVLERRKDAFCTNKNMLMDHIAKVIG